MAHTKKTDKTPDPMTLVDAMRLTRSMTKMVPGQLARADVEVSKRRIAFKLWEILDDGRLRMLACQYVYCAVSTKSQARAEWRWFCDTILGAF
jgi:hypothetical protein